MNVCKFRCKNMQGPIKEKKTIFMLKPMFSFDSRILIEMIFKLHF